MKTDRERGTSRNDLRIFVSFAAASKERKKMDLITCYKKKENEKELFASHFVE